MDIDCRGHGIELEKCIQSPDKSNRSRSSSHISAPSLPSRISATSSRMTFGNSNIFESTLPSNRPSAATLTFFLVTHRNPSSVEHNTAPDDSPNVPNALTMQDGSKARPSSETMTSKFVDMMSSCRIRARVHAERTTRCVCSPKRGRSTSTETSEGAQPQRVRTSAQARRIWVMKSCTAPSSSRGLSERRWATVRARQREDVACGSIACMRVCTCKNKYCASVEDQHRRRQTDGRRKLRRMPVDHTGGERVPPNDLLTREGGQRVHPAWTKHPLLPGSCVLVTSCRGHKWSRSQSHPQRAAKSLN